MVRLIAPSNKFRSKSSMARDTKATMRGKKLSVKKDTFRGWNWMWSPSCFLLGAEAFESNEPVSTPILSISLVVYCFMF